MDARRPLRGQSKKDECDSSDDEFLATANKKTVNREKVKPAVQVYTKPKKIGQRKRSTEGGLFDSDKETVSKEAPKVARASRGKCWNLGQSSSSRRPVLGEADGSYDRALASSEQTEGDVTSVEGSGIKAPPMLSSAQVELLDSEAMKMHAGILLESVCNVCKASGNLKGTFIKYLKQAARGLKDMVEVLAERSATDESRRVSRENRVLMQQVEGLKSEVKAWKIEAEEKREEARKAWKDRDSQPPHDWQESLAAAVEKMGQSLQNVCGGMINARFEGLEERLLPKKVVRPPLAADKRVAAPALAGVKRVRAEAAPAAETADTITPPLGVEWAQLPAADSDRDPLSMELASWSTVARKKKAPKAAAPAPVATPAPKIKPKVPAPPRTAAVIITLQPGALEKGEDYRSVLAKVQNRISLNDCGITELSLRSTAMGSKIIEIPGPQGAERADSLASKLQEAVGDLVTVARPIKKVDIRIIDIDDTVSKEDVVKAVADRGGCESTHIRAGDIHYYGRGMGALHMSLPAVAAKTLVEEGRLKVGWSVTRIQALEARPLRCFKCMGVGHTQPLCPSTTDRRANCYKCGEIGHKAAVCVVLKPRCAICSEAGKPADHIMGSVVCKPPSTKPRSTPAVGVREESSNVAARAEDLTRSEEAEMEL